ncbi:unnamed protein product [Owenia fusiformis]|uniref:Metalloendopeptidase n=1 Tax=Owenia fusiformis TaxID=6347 RepID=A0A8S4P0W0_OWEFU|nr:unnamed protein product [Owenia fusiformis]
MHIIEICYHLLFVFVQISMQHEVCNTRDSLGNLGNSDNYGNNHQRIGHYGSRRKRGLTHIDVKIWPNGIIPYYFHEKFRENLKCKVFAAMREWESGTCIKFRPSVSTDRNILEIYHGKHGCACHVGMRTTTQLSLNESTCFVHRIVLHELGHAIGLNHEHIRPDRGDHIQVNWAKIDNKGRPNFHKMRWDKANMYGVPYDPFSVMHYAKGSHGVEVFKTKRRGLSNAIGVLNRLSQGDRDTVNRMYGCDVSALNDAGLVAKTEGELMIVQCPTGSSIDVLHASYGTTIPGSTSVTSIRCQSTDTVLIVKRKCQNTNWCLLPVTDKLFGNPCLNAEKSLEIRHACCLPTQGCKKPSGFKSVNNRHTRPIRLYFNNRRNSSITLHWIDFQGKFETYWDIAPSKKMDFETSSTHPFVAKDKVTGEFLQIGGACVYYPLHSNVDIK